ncbi:family 10 glycosylhydrolase [Cohnella abietis]|uniref:Family 10 glycosylhydrolase n=1 Tax=Cohnella abietis TaxID=2507935 RepID=A0A3T1D853_9BACL|nr:family 10 glycosylhydrolase [Cohnella abietis]BBI34261.1 hypothetical protein KCTCHS21_36600 [Cohnella abietis]
MKLFYRILYTLLSIVLFLPVLGDTSFAKEPTVIRIYLDGNQINSEAAPYIIPKVNITMVPLTVITKNLGAGASWEQNTKTATITKSDLTLIMTVGQKNVLVNGQSISLDTSVQLINGRIVVPLRFVSNQLGLLVAWNQALQTINLQSNNDIDNGNGSGNGNGNGNGDGSTEKKLLNGAWVSTVYNLDWPSSGSYGKSAKQQQEYVQMLDELQAVGMNSVFVQVRPSADSFYKSALVPWSKYLTGKQGLAPDYDPLAFMIEETHKRGMEFHAWFNPFRANTEVKTENLAPNHVAITHPEWIVTSGTIMYINPGIPDARQHIIDVIMEVVNNYDIDGVHLDDYFYPSSGIFADDITYLTNNSGSILNKEDWRRDNINQFVQQLGKSIHQSKPKLQFGISPFGVWRNLAKDKSGSDTKASVTAYDSMYADVRTWIKQDWIDYVVPQIYWSLTFSAARYDKLVDWWVNEVKGTGVDLYIGHAPYKLGSKDAADWSNAQEIINQLIYNEQYSEIIKGDIFFSANHLRKNPLGLIPLLKSYYKL